jgi:hypothetical protein
VSTRTDRALARPPVSRHRAVAVGVVIALSLVGLAALAVRDLAVSQRWAAGEPWLAAGLRALDGLEPTSGVLAVATALGVAGLLLVLAGLLPAGRRHVRATDAEHLWSSPSALAEVARSAVDRSQGVVSARVARASRGRVLIDVATRDEGSAAAGTLEQARGLAGGAAAALGARRVDVRTAEEESA